jgi:hypothetical protein
MSANQIFYLIRVYSGFHYSSENGNNWTTIIQKHFVDVIIPMKRDEWDG